MFRNHAGRIDRCAGGGVVMKSANNVLATLVLVLLAASCGGEDAPAKGNMPQLNACELFTAADAGEVLGASASQPGSYTKMDRTDEQMGAALSNCVYARDDSYETLSIVVNYRRSGFPASFDELRAESEGDGEMESMTRELLDASEPVDGLGDFAYWTADGAILTVYAKRHYMIAVTADSATPGDPASARERATSVAKKIISRL